VLSGVGAGAGTATGPGTGLDREGVGEKGKSGRGGRVPLRCARE
jgi:hypothetical protein